jgi:hypothetical protein
MIRLRNNSGKLIMIGLDKFTIDMQPNQEVMVQKEFLNKFKSCLSMIEEIEIPEKLVFDPFGRLISPEEKKLQEMPKENVKNDDLYTAEELNKLSFSELRSIGWNLNPQVTDRSKDKLIKELLKRGVKK